MSLQKAMACVPVRNLLVEETNRTAKTVTLSFPLRMRPWFSKFTTAFGHEPPAQKKHLELDELGTFCWSLINDKRSVQAIAIELSKTYKLHPEESRVAVSQFIRQLGKRGVIGLKEGAS
ncbi:PqqD family protein [Halodesulfovibrio marinisediminis]|uniref:Coenzyme PQQ synthesis protein D (PqqD) n=1 Tax=Halodesulfovibrio marinisediminis DSM 17456 TaxID=1121457 RepID=A0A1N6ITF7_9BACT|nr:PqqD family protein [Halodesulfovibrio marinisediminis]SIO35292.1 Coenzyme PQQ synthesis protein D (PqqD) [Halodesulfovibrio marinisediminis DSM 17456]